MKFQIEVIKSKIHRVTVTQADLNYVGSITIDEALMDELRRIKAETEPAEILLVVAAKPGPDAENAAAAKS